MAFFQAISLIKLWVLVEDVAIIGGICMANKLYQFNDQNFLPYYATSPTALIAAGQLLLERQLQKTINDWSGLACINCQLQAQC